jgi:hypothetical protein
VAGATFDGGGAMGNGTYWNSEPMANFSRSASFLSCTDIPTCETLREQHSTLEMRFALIAVVVVVVAVGIEIQSHQHISGIEMILLLSL